MIAAALASAVADASAYFSCKDANGKTLFDSSPPKGCMGEICEIDPQSGKRKCTPPPETAAQRQKRKEAEKRKAECEKTARVQHLDELRFLDKYWSDDIIENERNGALSIEGLY